MSFLVDCAKVKVGQIGFCACNAAKQPCSENDGDCDFDHHCQGGHRCQSKSCASSLGFDSNTDCCQKANIGDEDFCTIDEPCGVDEGDCDVDVECRNGLFCASENCHNSIYSSYEIDCCGPKGNSFCSFL